MSDDDQQQSDEHRCPCRRRITAGWYLCEHCSKRLGDDLLEIADRYHKLSAAPAMQPGKYDRSGSNKPGSRPPLNLNVVAMRDPRSGRAEPTFWHGRDGTRHEEPAGDTPSVLRELGQWVGALAAHLGYQHMPAPHVDDVVAWLNRQGEQIAKWYDAPGLLRGARLLRNRLRAANNDANDKPLPAPCFDDVTLPDGTVRECGHPIFPPDAGTGAPAACTGRPRHEYNSRRLVTLRLDMEIKERKRQETEANNEGEQEAC